MAKRWLVEGAGLDALRLVDAQVSAPGVGEVTIRVRAAGMNPADYKRVAEPTAFGARLPLPIGYEVAGVISALGPDTEIASGGGAVGDEVLAFRVSGGYATELTVAAADVFAKPASLGFAEAANLLLVGCTAAEMLQVTHVAAGETILVHGASGAVGVSVLQQAQLIGAHVIGTASLANHGTVRRYGGEPVAYGPGLLRRLHGMLPAGADAALDCVGTDEAVDASLALVGDRSRIVTIAAAGRAASDGFTAIGGTMPASAAFRDAARARLIALAASGDLVVPVARSYPFERAVEALRVLQTGHPGGKLALMV